MSIHTQGLTHQQDSDRLLKQFLEDQLADSMPVVYVSMGTRAQLSPETVHVIAEALAYVRSFAVSFLWLYSGTLRRRV